MKMNLIPAENISGCPANQRLAIEGTAMEIPLLKTEDGLKVLDGQMRLRAALSLHDEVIVAAPGVGKFLIVKLPDGSLVAIQNEQTIALFGM